MRLAILFTALLLDRLAGDPDWLWRRLPHPVVFFGWLIGLGDRHLNRAEWSPRKRRMAGRLFLLAMVLAMLGLGLMAGAALEPLGWFGVLIEILLVALFLAQKSLFDHVRAVAVALRREGIAGGRRAVSMIVGRDPDQLDQPGVCRAAIESLAENLSDGVVAPALWFAIGGLPGLLTYKFVNTADSMIGHMSDRHRDFGEASARLDDLMNWPAARLTALLLVAATRLREGSDPARDAATTALRDAGLHRSPNAGWPEAAMAGGLGLALGGPRRYGAIEVRAACLNAAGCRDAGPDEIDRALRLARTSCNLLAGSVAFLVLLYAFIG